MRDTQKTFKGKVTNSRNPGYDLVTNKRLYMSLPLPENRVIKDFCGLENEV